MGSETEGSERATDRRAILSLTYNLARGHHGHSHLIYSVVEEIKNLSVKYPLVSYQVTLMNLPVP